MKKIKLDSQKGITQLVILGIMALLAVALPIATKLVQQNQENRSQATSVGSVCTKGDAAICTSGALYFCRETTSGSGKYIYKDKLACEYDLCRDGLHCAKCNSNRGCDSGYKCVVGVCQKDDSTPEKICTPDAKRCKSGFANILQTCNSLGTRWEDAGCPSGKECKNGTCVTKSVCTPKATRCPQGDKTSVDKCKDDGSDWIVGWDDCKTTEECRKVGSESKCVAKTTTTTTSCTPKATRCPQGDKTSVDKCKDDGSGWIVGWDDCKTTEECRKVGSESKCVAKTTTTCTSFTYTFENCVNGERKATVKTSYPEGCTGGSPITSDKNSCSSCCGSAHELSFDKDNAPSSGALCKAGSVGYDFKLNSSSNRWTWKCPENNSLCAADTNCYANVKGINPYSDYKLDTSMTSKYCAVNGNINTNKEPTTKCKSPYVVSSISKIGTVGEQIWQWRCNDTTAKKYTICTATYNDCQAKGGTCKTTCGVNDSHLGITNETLICDKKMCCKPKAIVAVGCDSISTNVGAIKCENGKLYTCVTEGSKPPRYFYKQTNDCNGKGCVQKTTTTAKCNSDDDGGGNNGNTPTGTQEITDIILSPNPLELQVGKSGKITVKTVPAGLKAQYIWNNIGATIATVDQTGKVKAKLVGETEIKVTVKGTSISKTVKVKVTAATDTLSDTSISFKVAFAGIVPFVSASDEDKNCINDYLIPQTRLKLEVANIPSNKFDNTIQSSFEGIGETDSKGNQIFQVTSQVLDKGKFGSVDKFNYIKIKGPWHLKRRMCKDGQNSKLPESTVCDIDLKSGSSGGGGKVYDFSEYTLLAGDITADGTNNQGDGVINNLDLGYVKTRMHASGPITCGIEGDLNMDGVVNTFDLNLVKDSLTERDDE